MPMCNVAYYPLFAQRMSIFSLIPVTILIPLQTWRENMTIREEPSITPLKKGIQDYTSVSFVPDLSRFGLPSDAAIPAGTSSRGASGGGISALPALPQPPPPVYANYLPFIAKPLPLVYANCLPFFSRPLIRLEHLHCPTTAATTAPDFTAAAGF